MRNNDLWSRIWFGPVCAVPGERLENPRLFHKEKKATANKRRGHPAPDPADPRVQIVVSTSGGKDSSALASYVVRNFGTPSNLTSEGKDRLIFVHADTGLEWPDAEEVSEAEVHYLSEVWPLLTPPGGFPFYVVAHHELDDLISWLDFVPKHGIFPGRQVRWCTSDFKRDPIDKWLRNHYLRPAGWSYARGAVNPPPELILVALGIRGLEGTARNKKRWGKSYKQGETGWSDAGELMNFREAASAQFRLIWDWFPIYQWSGDDRGDRPKEADGAPGPKAEPSVGLFWDGEENERVTVPPEEDVWTEIRAYGLPIGQAYKEGMSRMSCQFCIMGGKKDLLIALREFPQMAQRIARMERDLERTYKEECEKDPLAKPPWGGKLTYCERLKGTSSGPAPLGATLREGMFLDQLWEERPDLAPRGVPVPEPSSPPVQPSQPVQLALFNRGGMR